MAAEFGQGVLCELESHKQEDSRKSLQIQRLKAQLDEVSESNMDLLRQSKISISRLKYLSEKLSVAESTISRLTQNLELAESRIAELTSFARNSQVLESQVQFLETMRDSLQQELTDVKQDKTKAESQWIATEKLFTQLSHQYSVLEESLKETRDANTYHKREHHQRYRRVPGLVAPSRTHVVGTVTTSRRPLLVTKSTSIPLADFISGSSSSSSSSIESVESSSSAITVRPCSYEKECQLGESVEEYQTLASLLSNQESAKITRSTSFESIFSQARDDTVSHHHHHHLGKNVDRATLVYPQVSEQLAFATRSPPKQMGSSTSSRNLLANFEKTKRPNEGDASVPSWTFLFNRFRRQRASTYKETKTATATRQELVSLILSQTRPQSVDTSGLHDALDSYLF